MSQEDHIKTFWEDKQNFQSKEILKEKAREYYSTDFIDNYSRWKKNIDEINGLMREKLESDAFPMEYWVDMPFDTFCSNMNTMIEEWITLNDDIAPRDIPLILEKLMANYIAKAVELAYMNMYSSAALHKSMKTPKAYEN